MSFPLLLAALLFTTVDARVVASSSGGGVGFAFRLPTNNNSPALHSSSSSSSSSYSAKASLRTSVVEYPFATSTISPLLFAKPSSIILRSSFRGRTTSSSSSSTLLLLSSIRSDGNIDDEDMTNKNASVNVAASSSSSTIIESKGESNEQEQGGKTDDVEQTTSPKETTDDDNNGEESTVDDHDDAYFDQLFDSLTDHSSSKTNTKDGSNDGGGGDGSEDDNCVKLVDFIEQSVGIKEKDEGRMNKKSRRGGAKMKEKNIVTRSAFDVEGKEEDVIKVKGEIGRDGDGDVNAKEEEEVGCFDDDDDGQNSTRTGETDVSKDCTASNEFTMASEIAHPPVAQPPKSSSSKSSTSRMDNVAIPMSTTAAIMEEQPPPSVREKKEAPYNVVCTHITADFDTLASAIGLAKLWSLGIYNDDVDESNMDDIVNGPLPTYVVLPRGAHPDVQRFLSLHKHLFPIRSLKSLPGFSDNDLKNKKGNKNGSNNNTNNNNNDTNNNNPNEGLQRVGLVDAQRRDRLGPAEVLLPHAKLGVTIVDHHVDAESDIQEARNYVVENVGSVSTMIAERLKIKGVELTEAEATILALGIHSDTGSLVYDSTTPKDASMLAWAMGMGASQTAIAEHAKPTLSNEQQGVLTQALININSTEVHGVTIATVLLSADGFIPGLASVTKDALDLSSSDVFLLAVCYEATRARGGGGGGGKSNRKKSNKSKNEGGEKKLNKDANERLQHAKRKTVKALSSRVSDPVVAEVPQLLPGVGGGLGSGSDMINSESWKGGDLAFQRQRLAATFAFYDMDRSGFLEKSEIFQALNTAGFLISKENFDALIGSIDTNGDGKIDFEEFVYFYTNMEEQRKWEAMRDEIEGKLPSTPSTMTIIGRVKAGVNVRNVNLNTLFQQFNGGGHPKAASATAKLDDESEAKEVLQGLVDELIDASLEQQLTVGDFMQSPVLSAKPTMTEKQVEDLFIRYDVRALPVVDDNNEVIGLVSYKEVSAAKMRLINKQEKRIRQIEKAAEQGKELPEGRPLESTLKGWMKQHVQTVEASLTMAEVEHVLLETDVGCIPVVVDNTKQLIGMVTRTDLLRQHRYYSSLHYHNKGFSDSIAARKPIIELRKKLKKFDIENE